MKKKILVISILLIIAIILIVGLFAIQFLNKSNNDGEIFNKNIIEPDRIIYRNQDGKYYEFLKGTTEYNEIINLIATSIRAYDGNGEIVNDEAIETLHSKSFIEFDYKTASKNYIIPLEKIDNQGVIKLADTGGKVCTQKIYNLNKIKKMAKILSQDKKSYSLEYREMISRNSIQTMEYKYLQQFKQINYKIYQTKIDNMESYNLYKGMCNLAFDEEITKDIFENNDLILTLSLVPKISVKVNIGNIKYSYEKMVDVNYQYTAHLLIVSKIVNTDCIYNTDFSEIESKVQYDNMLTEYDKQVENLDSEMFVINFDEFFEEYAATTTYISEEKAKEIADKGFEEAKRVVGSYDEDSEKITTMGIYPNNFFTRKSNERDKTYQEIVEVYAFARTDDMELNGVQIYVDKKLGKIVGADSFGD